MGKNLAVVSWQCGLASFGRVMEAVVKPRLARSMSEDPGRIRAPLVQSGWAWCVLQALLVSHAAAVRDNRLTLCGATRKCS